MAPRRPDRPRELAELTAWEEVHGAGQKTARKCGLTSTFLRDSRPDPRLLPRDAVPWASQWDCLIRPASLLKTQMDLGTGTIPMPGSARLGRPRNRGESISVVAGPCNNRNRAAGRDTKGGDTPFTHGCLTHPCEPIGLKLRAMYSLGPVHDATDVRLWFGSRHSRHAACRRCAADVKGAHGWRHRKLGTRRQVRHGVEGAE